MVKCKITGKNFCWKNSKGKNSKESKEFMRNTDKQEIAKENICY